MSHPRRDGSPSGRRLRRAAGALAVLVAGLGVPLAAALPVLAAGCATPSGVYRQGTPWPQQQLDPSRVWPDTDGHGQTVAVLGTGIDPANAQFRSGQVLPGADVLGGGSPTSDCDGRGTAAAGIVGAQPDAQTTFAGVAPGVALYPVRDTQTTGQQPSAPDPAVLAAAIRAATAARAGVVLVAFPATVDSADLRAATAAALAAGAVVVSPASAAQAGAQTYPTAYPGVLGVGGVDQDGAATGVESGAEVLISGPAKDLVSTSAGAGGRVGNAFPLTDPSYAAAYVAGAAALLRASAPSLTPAQVVTRLLLTADRAAGGGRDGRLGWGTVDPVAAVTSVLPADAPSPGSGAPAGPSGRVVPLPAPPSAAAPDRAPALVAVAALGLAASLLVVAFAVRRARARGQAGRQGVEPPTTTSAPIATPIMTPRS